MDRELLQVLNAGVTTFLSAVILIVVAQISRRLRGLEREQLRQQEIWLRLTGYLVGPQDNDPVDFAELSRRLGLNRRD